MSVESWQAAGYDDWGWLLEVNEADQAAAADAVGMKPGHKHKLLWKLREMAGAE